MATNYIIEKVTDSNGGADRIASTFYGTCSTAAGTAQKAVTISDSCTFNDNYLITGVTVHVKFTYSNTNATPTLKVGTATAKQIMAYGTTKSGTTETTSWYAGAVVSFTYDGTYWIQNDYKLDTNSGGTVTSVKVGSTSYQPSSGVVSLPAYPTVPTKTSDLTNDSGFITNSIVGGYESKEFEIVVGDTTNYPGTISSDQSQISLTASHPASGTSEFSIYGQTDAVNGWSGTLLRCESNSASDIKWSGYLVDIARHKVGDEVSLSNMYISGLAYSSKYVECSIFLAKYLSSDINLSTTVISGGNIAIYGANGQIYATSATYPTYELSGLRGAGVLTVKFTISPNFNTNNNNKPAVVWFGSGAKITFN